MDIIKALAEELNIGRHQAEAAVKLIDEGNTIPFIARYRKEATGSLNDEVLRNLDERLKYLRNLEDRKEQVISAISDQGKMTAELEKQIREAATLVAVEDLYRPYKPKRRTRAMIAREKGLEPLANVILLQNLKEPVEKAAEAYISVEKGVESVQDAINGAMDILAEGISDDAKYRTYIRNITMNKGLLQSTAKDGEKQSVYETYYNYEEPVKKAAGHRILALNRGEDEKILTVKVAAPTEQILGYLEKQVITKENPYTTPVLKAVIQDSYSRLIAPSVDREIRSELTDKAQEGAIRVFGKNLEQLLMQPPIAGKVVLGWDPAFRTGCKLAVVDKNGNMLDVSVIYPTPPNAKIKEAKEKMLQLLKKYPIDIIAIGNGTASRESEAFVAALIREYHLSAAYTIVSEAGASVYSASKLAREEFPNLHVEQRSAISIARRIIDPLSELIKIDPQSIGVGQYQHDLPTARLKDRLDFVVSKAVNRVGVNVNTASQELLKNISGLSQATAKSIVEYRREHGELKNRKELKKIPKIGAKSYEQAAGFLRIEDGDELLDRTSIHPESYATARKVLQQLGLSEQDMGSEQAQEAVQQTDADGLIRDCESDRYTIQDILEAIATPLRDYRERYDAPLLRSDVLELEDLHIGDQLEGVVRNVVDFGAFVDIGLHEDGLVHISKMSRHRIAHPSDKVSVGDIVKVWVYNIDEEKQKVQLSLLPMQ